MKNKLTTAFASLLMLVLCLTSGNTFAQTKTKSASMKECCMMKDGKMMHMKDGKTMPMDKNMTMKNGTMCLTTGECVMKNGEKIKMKDGDCMDMKGTLDKCTMMTTHTKHTTKKVTQKHSHGTS